MTGIKIDLLVLLGLLEVAVLLLVMALIFIFRSRNLARQVRSLRDQLKLARIEPDAIGFDQYLRDEILRNAGLIDQAAVSDKPEEREVVEPLKMRKQFLELELTAQEVQTNPVELQQRVVTGMQALIDMLRPEPEIITQVQAGAEQPAPVAEFTLQDADPERELHDTHNEELEHLRQVINNQHDAMVLLRSRLQEGCGEHENVEAILHELDVFEKQSNELHHCLEVLEAENERLKAGMQQGSPPASGLETDSHGSLAELRGMGEVQQASIANIHVLIKELAPDEQKARLLEDAMSRIQHANEELTGCVSVLEDENNLLRKALDRRAGEEQAQQTIAETEASDEVQPPVMADELHKELNIKLTELEALLEFKDATIEELEKQYNKLQSRYLADTGKTRID